MTITNEVPPVTVKIERVPGEEFFSDILITAFDGSYGYSWAWFEAVGPNWLTTSNAEDWLDQHWMSAHVRLKREYREDLKGAVTRDDGFVIDHAALAGGIQRILDDDYVEDAWKFATATETAKILDKYGSKAETGDLYGRKFRIVKPGVMKKFQIETGETARGYQGALGQILAFPDPDAGDIDAPFADAIVQVAAFGKCIFG
jgi:hypothetical protein